MPQALSHSFQMPYRHKIEDMFDAAMARVLARQAANSMGFPLKDSSALALAAGELATNLVQHAGGGELCLSYREGVFFIEATDRGPGFDGLMLPRCTTKGLGAIQILLDGLILEAREGGGLRVSAFKRRIP